MSSFFFFDVVVFIFYGFPPPPPPYELIFFSISFSLSLSCVVFVVRDEKEYLSR